HTQMFEQKGTFVSVGKWAVATGAAWTIQSLMSLAFPDPIDFLDYTMIVPIALALISLWQLRQAGSFGDGRPSQLVAGLSISGLFTVVLCDLRFARERHFLVPFEIVGTAALVLGLIAGGIAAICA